MLDAKGTQERLKWLCDEINRHDRLYYVEARPEIGDADYDRLYNEMLAIEREHPEWVLPDSPSQRVSGAPSTGFAQVRHDLPMRSLDKTHSKGELLEFDAFLKRQLPGETWDYVVEPKIDGVSLSLVYLDGKLVRAATRGNGEVGDDITANMKTVRSIPLSIADAPSVLEVRGECYMTRDGFLKLNAREEEAGREPFANPRNAAAGSMKQLNPAETARRPLEMLAYASGKIAGETYATHSSLTEAFKRWGFKTAPWARLCPNINAVLEAIDELETLRHSFPFEIDGAVIKVNQRALYSKLGATAHAPRWARAYKYAPERAKTTVRAITVQVGRSGVLTPVAELEPVALAGSEISRATLHNADEVARRDVRIGDRVWLVKAGDVIPAIDSVIKDERTGDEIVFQMPSLCPECSSPTLRLEGEVAYRCTNPECPAQQICRLEHFCSGNALDIRAIGGKIAEVLVQSGLVANLLDVFTLDAITLSELQISDDSGSMRKFGKNAITALASIEAAKALPLHRWLFALGIPGIGATVAEQVAQLHSDFADLASLAIAGRTADFYDAVERASSLNPKAAANRGLDGDKREELTERFLRCCGEIGVLGDELVAKGAARKVPGTQLPAQYICTIKPETAKSLRAFFTSAYGRKFAARMQELGIVAASEKKEVDSDGPLAGMTFVLTGTLSLPRLEVAAAIKAAGGAVQDTVSTKTMYLVAGANTGASKTAKAEKLGTKVIDEAELNAMLEKGRAKPDEHSQASSTEVGAPEVKIASRKKTKRPGDYTQGDLFGL